jgi:molybdopterin adenylyltransferase
MSLETHRAESGDSLGIAVVTFSDTRSLAEDRGGDYLAETCVAAGHRVLHRELVREDDEAIESAVRAAAGVEGVELVLTTGGTGIAPRDRTFDVLRRVLDSEIPGFGELFRWLSHAEVGSATILSRAIGGVLDGRVVLAMPGSTKALRLALEAIVLPEAGHLVSQVRKGR